MPDQPAPRRILTIDVGGTHVKVRRSGDPQERMAASGPAMTAAQMVAAVHALAHDWPVDAISIGFPGPVRHHLPAAEPVNLGRGWLGFDYAAAFGHPVRMVNDALLQAVGSYDGGRMLFLGLGTGLGSALIVENVAQPLELAHLPFRAGRSFEDEVGIRGLDRLGEPAWRDAVDDCITRLRNAMRPDYVVVGGGNVARLRQLPDGCRRGDNSLAFKGGERLWRDHALVL